MLGSCSCSTGMIGMRDRKLIPPPHICMYTSLSLSIYIYTHMIHYVYYIHTCIKLCTLYIQLCIVCVYIYIYTYIHTYTFVYHSIMWYLRQCRDRELLPSYSASLPLAVAVAVAVAVVSGSGSNSSSSRSDSDHMVIVTTANHNQLWLPLPLWLPTSTPLCSSPLCSSSMSVVVTMMLTMIPSPHKISLSLSLGRRVPAKVIFWFSPVPTLTHWNLHAPSCDQVWNTYI